MTDNTPLHRLIDRDRLVERTVELVQLPSVNPFDGPAGPTTGETAVAEWMAGHLDRLGFEPAITEAAPGRPNVVGQGPGNGGPVVALVGHTDTVGIEGCADPFGAQIAEGRIFGRGTCDMKGALAVFVEVAEVLNEGGHELQGHLAIAGVADEEHGMLGSLSLGKDGAIADYAIVGEPTELQVCRAHKGQYAFPIRTFGTAVHSSIADQGVNAIESMMQIIESIKHLGHDLQQRAPHDLCGHATMSVGTIRGGNMVSIVPDFCEIFVDRRVLPGESVEAIAQDLIAYVESRVEDRADFRWEIGEPIVDAGPLDTSADHPLVTAAVQAMTAQGKPAPATSFTGSTDAPNLGVPAVIWGPGSLSLAHTVNESIEIRELELATRVYLDAVLALVG